MSNEMGCDEANGGLFRRRYSGGRSERRPYEEYGKTATVVVLAVRG